MAGEQDRAIDLARAAPFTLGPLRVQPPILEVASADRRETLEPRIMQVFVALAQRRGDVVSREDLITQCWDGRSVGDDAINRCIGRLRRLAEAEGGFVIETVPRVGYRLKETAAPEAPAAEPVTPPARPRWRWAMTAAVVLTAVLAAGFHFWPSEPLNRVAVLPLQLLDKGDDARVFGTAVAEEIVGVLNENQMQAVSRDQIANLRGAGRDSAAKKLGADFILDGSVQHTSNGLSVMVHLDRASSHTTVWTGTFDQAGLDLVSLQNLVAARVVDEIQAALSAASVKDDAAMAAYLKAKELGRDGGRTAKMRRIDQMRIVVANAPDFSLGHSGLAWSAASHIPFAPAGEIRALRSEATREVAAALQLDPHNGEAYLALAALAPPLDYGEQERLFRLGLSVQPDEPTLNSSLAWLLEDVGRIREALPLFERAVMIDPLSPRKNAGLASVQALSGNLALARTTLNRIKQRWPNHPSIWSLDLYLSYTGDYERGRTVLAEGHRIAPQLEPDFFTALDACLVALAHPSPKTRTTARNAILAATARNHLDRGTAIEFLARLGAVDEAYGLIDQALAARPLKKRVARPETAILLRSSTAALRQDKRFLPLVERFGLLAYWKTHTAPDFCRSEAVAPCPDLKTARN